MNPGGVGSASQLSPAWLGCCLAAGAACLAGVALSYSARAALRSLLGPEADKDSPAGPAAAPPACVHNFAEDLEPAGMGETASQDKAKEVATCQEGILRRISQLEGKVNYADGNSRSNVLEMRQIRLLEALKALENKLGAEGQECLMALSSGPTTGQVSEVEARLTKVLQADGIKSFRFVRAPPEYYRESLDFRMGVVNAASIHHLCKSIVMQNTRAPPDVTDCSDPTLSKYYMVCVQYTAKLHAEKLHSFIRELAKRSGRSLSKKQVNMRLVPEEVNDELTGFSHNAVAPVGCAVKIPMIVSHKIAALDPDFFWLGGGEVDLKLGFSWKDFSEIYNPFVVDCTYD